MLENIVIGVVSSLSASALFLVFLYRLRPHIEISPTIAMETKPDGKVEYGFKFVNKTPYPITEVKVRIRLRSAEVAPGGLSRAGVIWDSKKLATTEIWQVPRFDKADQDCQYAQRMSVPLELEKIWDDTKTTELVFEVMAKHSLSGFSTVTTQTWKKKSAGIQPGKHHYGADLGVS